MSGTQFPADNAPILLLPAVSLASGSFAANYASGYFVLDPVTGHGIGTINVSGSVSSAMTMFIVRPDKIIMLQMPTQYVNGSLAWLTSD